MKKVLLATSILAASAGFASAEVAVTGTARMGLVYDGDDTSFSSRIRIIFTASGETDGGLSFGASVRNDQSGVGNTSNDDSTVYISGAFGKLTFGDVDSAANSLVGDVSDVGFTGLGSYNEHYFMIGDYYDDDTAALYEYSAGALSFALSATQPGDADFTGYSAAVKYSTDAYGVALGYESVEDWSALSLGGSATFGAVTAKAAVIKYEDSDTEYALSLDYTTGAATLTAFYRDGWNWDGSDWLKIEAIGVGAAYDLGGGAKVKGGIVQVSTDGVDDTIADVGVTMSF